MFLLIMVVIGVVNDNNLWLYAALGLSGLGIVINAAKAEAQKKAAAEQLQQGIDNLFKGLKSTQN